MPVFRNVAGALSLLLGLAVGSCGVQSEPNEYARCASATQETRDAIAAQLARHGAGKRAGDLPEIMSIMTDDVQLFPEEGKVIQGRSALEAIYRDLLLKIRFDSLTYAPGEVRDCGGVIVELGEARGGVTPASAAPIHIAVRYLHLWDRASDGSWLLSVAMDQPLTP